MQNKREGLITTEWFGWLKEEKVNTFGGLWWMREYPPLLSYLKRFHIETKERYWFEFGLYCNSKATFIWIWVFISFLRVLSTPPGPIQALNPKREQSQKWKTTEDNNTFTFFIFTFTFFIEDGHQAGCRCCLPQLFSCLSPTPPRAPPSQVDVIPPLFWVW